MKNKLLILLFLLISLCASFGVASEVPNVFLTFTDSITKEKIDGVIVTVTDQDQVNQYFLEENENLKLLIPSGKNVMNFLINDQQTVGFDYYGFMQIDIKETFVKSIYIHPVGSVRGVVKDNLDNVISNADLKFECNSPFSVVYPSTTDKFGSFSIDAVPTGKCLISASYKGNIGITQIVVLQGERVNVEIILDSVVIGGSQLQNIIFYVVLIFFIIFVGMILNKKKREKKKTKGKITHLEKIKKNEKKSTPNRSHDIFKTLRSNEKKIVEFLLEQKHPLYLSKIHHKTGMSKGSLFRNLRSLEHKNIVETNSEGRVRKVKLSKWFLGEE